MSGRDDERGIARDVAERREAECALGMNQSFGVEVPDGALLEATVIRRQLRETCRPTSAYRVEPVRACGMEAGGGPPHRTKVKPRKAGPTWVSARCSAKPDIQSRWDGIGDGGGGTRLVLTPGDLGGSAVSGRRREDYDALPMFAEESDHLVVALKPGNAGGAKGVTN